MTKCATVFHVCFWTQLEVIEIDSLLDDRNCEAARRLDYNTDKLIYI